MAAEPRPKKTEQILVRLDEVLGGDFAKAVKSANLTPQDALRIAAAALVAYHKQHGRIPKDMRIEQDFIVLTEHQREIMWAVAEMGKALEMDLGPRKSVIYQQGKTGRKEKPPDRSQRHPGDGPRRAVS